MCKEAGVKHEELRGWQRRAEKFGWKVKVSAINPLFSDHRKPFS
jgi:hypothetical protein